jgi:hypothetical protein
VREFQELYWGEAKIPDEPHHAYGTDPIRLKASAIFAFEDYIKGSTITKAFPLEVLLYYYGTRQVSEAIRLSRAELARVKTAYFADVEIPPDALWISTLEPITCLFKLVENNWLVKALELKYYKRRRWKT